MAGIGNLIMQSHLGYSDGTHYHTVSISFGRIDMCIECNTIVSVPFSLILHLYYTMQDLQGLCPIHAMVPLVMLSLHVALYDQSEELEV